MSLAAFGAWWTTTILPWAIDSTLVGLMLLVILRLGRASAPAWRKGVATIGLAKMAIPPQLLPIGVVSLGVLASDGGSPEPLGAPLAGVATGILGIVHLLGVAVGLALLARRALELRRLRTTAREVKPGAFRELTDELALELGLRRAPKVIESERVDAPFVSGLFDPTVALPVGLADADDPARLRGILAHELVHLRRGDLWLAWVRAVVLAFWWPSPVARALAGSQERAVEESCDDAVLATGLSTPRDYARGLLAVAIDVTRRRQGLVAGAIGAHRLEDRILRFSMPAASRLRWSSALLLLTLALLSLPPIATGRVSPAGWTRAVLFDHRGSTAPSPGAASLAPTSSAAGHATRHSQQHRQGH